jgi:DNA processing protein
MNRSASLRDILIALNAAPRLGRESVCRLAAHLDAWLESGAEEPAQQLGISSEQLREARRVAARATIEANAEQQNAEQRRVRMLTRLDAEYPRPLFELALPPPVLYVKGRLPAAPGVAIVGSRKADAYGLAVASSFARELAASGLAVVSGLAPGVDAAAHQHSLLAGGATVAVLGCGIDFPYPRDHQRLAAAIGEEGALLSEFPLGTAPRSWHFPVRNRVIAALSFGTLVVQAGVRSGSLITARYALELGREVYAVPGSIFCDLSRGTHALVRDGAQIVERTTDLLETLPLAIQEPLRRNVAARRPPRDDEKPPPTGFLATVLAAVAAEERSADDIAALLEVSIEAALPALLELELGGQIRRCAGSKYVRVE